MKPTRLLTAGSGVPYASVNNAHCASPPKNAEYARQPMHPIKRRRPELDSVNNVINTCGSNVNNEHNTLDECDRATRRYLGLVQELADECGAPKHGWQIRVATRLGIGSSFLSKLLSGSRAIIGADSIDKAVHQMGLRRAYFEDHRDPISYADYLGAEMVSDEPTFDGWFEFLESPIEPAITDSERRMLASTVFEPGYDPPCAYYQGHLYLLRGLVTPAEMKRGVEKAAELEARLRAQRNRR
jgi:hypothetical protein